jgi:agmatinase
MDPLRELELLLRPAGGGLYVVSTGRAQQLALQRLIYGAATENEVLARWREALAAARGERLLVLGVPSDVGAGIRRGASEGPQAIRAWLAGEDPGFWQRAAARGAVDVGDVFAVPQLLEDDMLSERQKAATRLALFPGLSEAEAAGLPVSPLSIAGRSLELLLAAAPGAAPVILGGDHSVAWPAVERLAAIRPGLAILHVDAHTDLLPERLGVRHCFATWAWHANELLGRSGRLVQVGIRASRHDRAHWESSLGVRQIWAAEVRRDPERALDASIEALRAAGARSIYFSNDVDGTDETFADATGTPEPDGLHPDFVCALLRRAAREFPVAGADIVEVAPALAPAGRTLETAGRYLRETIEAILGEAV